MACLIKAPDASGKGCVSFTTPERDQLIKKDPKARAAVESLKQRYFIGLHHNWHDHDFVYDPLFDFSMAGEADLVERDGLEFPRVGIDACNFAPTCFGSAQKAQPFWDVLNVSRAVAFKGIPEFFDAIRAIYDRGRFIRVLHLCPLEISENPGVVHDIRQRYEAQFNSDERLTFSLITMDWDYPFPLDLETLAFFYRSSRVFVHPAPDERRSRTASYAWADRMPVVARANVASILPASLRRKPFLFEFETSHGMADAIVGALDSEKGDPDWEDVSNEFSGVSSGEKLAAFLDNLAAARGQKMSHLAINVNRFDIRLGRHHLNALGRNGVPQDLISFCDALACRRESELAAATAGDDPEILIANAEPVSLSRRLFRRFTR
jgi:glycosyltransferase involved in cell wall biosynthesis